MNLTLYHVEGCQYCQKVRDFMMQNGIIIPLIDIHQNRVYIDELIKIGGKKQVPCLMINGKALYESDDIINWLKKNWKKI